MAGVDRTPTSVDYHAAAMKMDAGVDNHLGDSIEYSTTGGGVFETIKGFIIPVDDDADYGNRKIEAGPRRWRAKISRSLVSSPDPSHRLKCDQVLGDGVYRPSNRSPSVQGRYYVFDLLKV